MRKKLKKKRIENNLTQEDIAKEVGIHRAHYTNIELGKVNPSFKVIVKIKKVLDYYKDDLFFDSNVYNIHEKAN
ncbi:MAG: hypothetical protein BHK79_02820 [Halanaerobium sp. MDAL1]|nr:MAG: hypothetical protein BHK79_02820 [Halanaerobium sp. MDAL1]